jgi:hypothetical protein
MTMSISANKHSFITLLVSENAHNLHNFSKKVKKESAEIYDSCRIFRNNKSNPISQLDQKNIFITL